MSEYQYYEFLAVDRRLDGDQQAELRALSSDAVITPTSFTNTYHWGGFKGEPRAVMEQYFDAFLYTANWGTRQLMLRVPGKLVDLEIAKGYCSTDVANVWTHGDDLIIEISCDSEHDDTWDDNDEGEGRLGSIVPARSDLMAGDLRLLYLGWLLSADTGMLDDKELEPPVPPNLAMLPSALYSVADFLRLDPDLLAAAAEGSDDAETSESDAEELADWIAQLPEEEKDTLLLRVAHGDAPLVRIELLRQFKNPDEDLPESEPRTVGELLYRAAQLRAERE